ncbi:MAG: NAD(P)/FAD-dependent oxidoreductase [Ginsengibacter sp.]
MVKKDYDAVVIGSGPNGLSAAVVLQKAGLSVLLAEAKSTIGGGLRTAELTLPGFKHDICSAIHPLAADSPFLKTLPLSEYGLEYIYTPVSAAHPFINSTAAVLKNSVEETAASLMNDSESYQKFITPLIENWPDISKDVLGPLTFPAHPLAMAKFGLKAIPSALQIARHFKYEKARGLWAGMAAHSIQPLSNLTTSAIGLVLLIVGHTRGWPIPKGGSQQIANALGDYFKSLGGTIETNFNVTSLEQLPSSHCILFDTTPKQLLQIAGHKMSPLYKWQLNRYRYGLGVYKIDWALNEPIPFLSKECSEAATVHLGNTLEEIAYGEQITWNGGHPEKPFVLLSQQSMFDKTRAPEGRHTAWGYCHVPNGSKVSMINAIENQIERFAPGFKDCILARHTMNTADLEDYNSNYIGGDINGGVIDAGQLFTRPALRFSPYRTSEKGIYICSSSTPPGAGVHGMCGYYAAKRALKDIFKRALGNL